MHRVGLDLCGKMTNANRMNSNAPSGSKHIKGTMKQMVASLVV